MTTATDHRAVLSQARRAYRRACGGFGIAQKGATFRKSFVPFLVDAWRAGQQAERRPLTRLEAVDRQIALLPYRANYREAESARVSLVADRAALIAGR